MAEALLISFKQVPPDRVESDELSLRLSTASSRDPMVDVALYWVREEP